MSIGICCLCAAPIGGIHQPYCDRDGDVTISDAWED